MTDYTQLSVRLTPCNEDIADLAAQALADIGYESFEPVEGGVEAYIKTDSYDSEAAEEALRALPFEISDLSLTSEVIKGEDWNSEWEKNYFQPIVVGGKVAVHSSFHHDVPEAEYDISIDPKMAFGTGHHSTTSMMLRLILDSDMTGSNVIDMGTGTAILAILAKMRGADKVTGIDIEQDATDNALENARLNNVEIDVYTGDARLLDRHKDADYLLANINRNVLLGDMARYAASVKPGGRIFLSGFYEADIPMLLEEAGRHGLENGRRLSDNGWAALEVIKKN